MIQFLVKVAIIVLVARGYMSSIDIMAIDKDPTLALPVFAGFFGIVLPIVYFTWRLDF